METNALNSEKKCLNAFEKNKECHMTTRRFKVDKLIRDKMPEILSSKNIKFSTRQMDDAEFLMRLKNKLVEEAQEVCAAKSDKELLEELADVSEVLITLAQLSGISLDEIEKARIQKRSAKGGFDQRVYNKEVEIDAHNSAIEYYRARPNDYPEIE